MKIDNANLAHIPENITDHISSLPSLVVKKYSEDGANGYTFICENLILNKRVVYKYCPRVDGSSEFIEPQTLSSLNHPGILRVSSAEILDEDYFYILTDYCQNGNLQNYIYENNISLDTVIDIITSLCNSASYLHSKSIIHRDLKPSNIFIDEDGGVIIGDFGSARYVGEDGFGNSKSQHSLIFRPPESFDSGLYSAKSDLYQIGIVLYLLLGGSLDYDGKSYLNKIQIKKMEEISCPIDRQIYNNSIIEEKIKKGKIFDFGSFGDHIPSGMKSIVKKMLSSDPALRHSSLSEVVSLLAKERDSLIPWVQEGKSIIAIGSTSVKVTLEEGGRVNVYKKRTNSWRKVSAPGDLGMKDAIRQAKEIYRR